jgi:small-conductance mechanosensitive channel
MESTPPAEQLRIIERGEAAPYVHFPPTPWWYFPAVGAWAAALVGAFSWWRVNAALFAGSLALLIALEALFIAWLKRRHGALPLPGHGRPPAEIASVWRGYVAGLALVIAAIAAAWWLGGVAAGAVAAFATVTAGLALYERRYAAAAARVRERLR